MIKRVIVGALESLKDHTFHQRASTSCTIDRVHLEMLGRAGEEKRAICLLYPTASPLRQMRTSMNVFTKKSAQCSFHSQLDLTVNGCKSVLYRAVIVFYYERDGRAKEVFHSSCAVKSECFMDPKPTATCEKVSFVELFPCFGPNQACLGKPSLFVTNCGRSVFAPAAPACPR